MKNKGLAITLSTISLCCSIVCLAIDIKRYIDQIKTVRNVEEKEEK